MRRSWLVLIGLGAVVVLAFATAVPIAILTFVLNTTGESDRCAQPVGTCAVELSVSEIEELSSLELPEGTEVVESEYLSALDWMMTATVRLPYGAPPPVLDPDLPWDGSTLGPDGVAREVTTVVLDDGRIELRIRAFNT